MFSEEKHRSRQKNADGEFSLFRFFCSGKRNEKPMRLEHNSKHPLPITPHRLPIRSGRSIRRNRDTAIRALARSRVTVLVLVLTLVDGFLNLIDQLAERFTAGRVVKTEITLGIAGTQDVLFIAHRLNMALEVLQHFREAFHEYQAQSTAHGHDLYPLLLIGQLVHIAFPSKSYRSRSNTINGITLFFF